LFAVGDVDGMARAVGVLLRDPQIRAREGAAGREIVEHTLAPAKILPKIDAIYRFAVASARDRSRKYIDRAAMQGRPTGSI
jgi:glycosyltransferase involved in cell wall biosynthesis